MNGGKRPGSGRPKGTPNKNTKLLEDKLAEMGCDPREIMALIAINQLPCGVCRGSGKTLARKPLKPRLKCGNCGYENPLAFVKCVVCDGEPEIELAPRTCMSCYGTLMEACNPKLRGEMASDLLEYLLPKRRAIDHQNPDGSALDLGVRIVFVKPEANGHA